MKKIGIELYYANSEKKFIRFEEPIMFNWPKYCMRLEHSPLRPIGLNIFVSSEMCKYKDLIVKYILEYKKLIIMGIHPLHTKEVEEYLNRFEKEFNKDRINE